MKYTSIKICLVIVALFGGVAAASDLPECPNKYKWRHNCFSASAATAILDRGYGRPTKTTSLEVNAPFVPTEIRLVAYTGSVSD